MSAFNLLPFILIFISESRSPFTSFISPAKLSFKMLFFKILREIFLFFILFCLAKSMAFESNFKVLFKSFIFPSAFAFISKTPASLFTKDTNSPLKSPFKAFKSPSI